MYVSLLLLGLGGGLCIDMICYRWERGLRGGDRKLTTNSIFTPDCLSSGGEGSLWFPYLHLAVCLQGEKIHYDPPIYTWLFVFRGRGFTMIPLFTPDCLSSGGRWFTIIPLFTPGCLSSGGRGFTMIPLFTPGCLSSGGRGLTLIPLFTPGCFVFRGGRRFIMIPLFTPGCLSSRREDLLWFPYLHLTVCLQGERIYYYSPIYTWLFVFRERRFTMIPLFTPGCLSSGREDSLWFPYLHLAVCLQREKIYYDSPIYTRLFVFRGRRFTMIPLFTPGCLSSGREDSLWFPYLHLTVLQGERIYYDSLFTPDCLSSGREDLLWYPYLHPTVYLQGERIYYDSPIYTWLFIFRERGFTMIPLYTPDCLSSGREDSLWFPYLHPTVYLQGERIYYDSPICTWLFIFRERGFTMIPLFTPDCLSSGREDLLWFPYLHLTVCLQGERIYYDSLFTPDCLSSGREDLLWYPYLHPTVYLQGERIYYDSPIYTRLFIFREGDLLWFPYLHLAVYLQGERIYYDSPIYTWLFVFRERGFTMIPLFTPGCLSSGREDSLWFPYLHLAVYLQGERIHSDSPIYTRLFIFRERGFTMIPLFTPGCLSSGREDLLWFPYLHLAVYLQGERIHSDSPIYTRLFIFRERGLTLIPIFIPDCLSSGGEDLLWFPYLHLTVCLQGERIHSDSPIYTWLFVFRRRRFTMIPLFIPDCLSSGREDLLWFPYLHPTVYLQGERIHSNSPIYTRLFIFMERGFTMIPLFTPDCLSSRREDWLWFPYLHLTVCLQGERIHSDSPIYTRLFIFRERGFTMIPLFTPDCLSSGREDSLWFLYLHPTVCLQGERIHYDSPIYTWLFVFRERGFTIIPLFTPDWLTSEGRRFTLIPLFTPGCLSSEGRRFTLIPLFTPGCLSSGRGFTMIPLFTPGCLSSGERIHYDSPIYTWLFVFRGEKIHYDFPIYIIFIKHLRIRTYGTLIK